MNHVICKVALSTRARFIHRAQRSLPFKFQVEIYSTAIFIFLIFYPLRSIWRTMPPAADYNYNYFPSKTNICERATCNQKLCSKWLCLWTTRGVHMRSGCCCACKHESPTIRIIWLETYFLLSLRGDLTRCLRFDSSALCEKKSSVRRKRRRLVDETSPMQVTNVKRK